MGSALKGANMEKLVVNSILDFIDTVLEIPEQTLYLSFFAVRMSL